LLLGCHASQVVGDERAEGQIESVGALRAVRRSVRDGRLQRDRDVLDRRQHDAILDRHVVAQQRQRVCQAQDGAHTRDRVIHVELADRDQRARQHRPDALVRRRVQVVAGHREAHPGALRGRRDLAVEVRHGFVRVSYRPFAEYV
jgi:hypothetical protein